MDIKNIIKEEFKKLLKEGFVMEDDKLKFQQFIEKPAFYNYQNFSNDYDVEINESNISIGWRIAFWLNDAGIENFIIQGDNVDGTYKVVLRDKQTDEISQEIDKNINETQWKFIVLEPADLDMGGSLYIQSANFDFSTKICSITMTN